MSVDSVELSWELVPEEKYDAMWSLEITEVLHKTRGLPVDPYWTPERGAAERAAWLAGVAASMDDRLGRPLVNAVRHAIASQVGMTPAVVPEALLLAGDVPAAWLVTFCEKWWRVCAWHVHCAARVWHGVGLDEVPAEAARRQLLEAFKVMHAGRLTWNSVASAVFRKEGKGRKA